MSEDERSGLVSDATSLDHDVVVVNDTVMWESSEWSDVLLSQIVIGGSVVVNSFVSGLSYLKLETCSGCWSVRSMS